MELKGKKAGVVGLGRIGMKVAQTLQVLGMELMGYDPYVPPNTLQGAGICPVDLETLLRDSDVVTFSVVLTSETQHMIGKKELRMMKPHALLINTSRGGVVDEKALLEALTNEWIGGAGLDVFEKEPPDPDHPLLSLDNVIMTPHVAGWTEEGQHHIIWAGARNCMQALEGELPAYMRNPEVIPRWKERIQRLEKSRGS
jgi:D-3-phosphoglycerate dehydrogenase